MRDRGPLVCMCLALLAGMFDAQMVAVSTLNGPKRDAAINRRQEVIQATREAFLNDEEFEVAVPMTHESYLQYALSEARVERAIMNGAAETDIRDWCSNTLAEIFAGQPREVLFDAYLAVIERAAVR